MASMLRETSFSEWSWRNLISGPHPTVIPYTVISREQSGASLMERGIRSLSIDVRVSLVDGRRPNEGELGNIFSKLGSCHDRISISFYLPGMEVGAGAFATAHLDRTVSDPTVKVRINL